MAGPAGLTDPGAACAADLRDALADWTAWLEQQKRSSPHTLAAYQGDLSAFLGLRSTTSRGCGQPTSGLG